MGAFASLVGWIAGRPGASGARAERAARLFFPRRRRRRRLLGFTELDHGSPRSVAPRTRPVRPEHRLPHPVPGDLDRACLDPRLLPGALRAHRRPDLARALPAVDQDLRAHVRDGRGDRHHDVVPVRHQLARLHEQGRQRRGAAPRLRGAHRLLPGGDVPRRDALRHEPRARLAASSVDGRGRRGDHAVGLLDPRAQLVDAHAGGRTPMSTASSSPPTGCR